MNLGDILYGGRNTGHSTKNPIVRYIVLKRYNYRCQGCRRLYTNNRLAASHNPTIYFYNLHIDHIIPYSQGGRNHIDNYQPMCRECNIQKSNKLPEEL